MITRSAPCDRSKAVVSDARLSRAIGRMRGAAPIAVSIAASPYVFEAMIWSALGVSPGMTNSSPVDINATMGARATGTCAMFIEARRATSPGSSRRGACICVPISKSTPAGRMLLFASLSSEIVITSPVRCTSSWMMTLSAPSGTGAPVKIRTH